MSPSPAQSPRPRCYVRLMLYVPWRLLSGCIHDAVQGDSCDFDSFCDYDSTPNPWDDDEVLDECSGALSGCERDEDCNQCLQSAAEGDDDDVIETCGFPPSDDTCSSWAEFYCCAAKTDMDNGCEDNSELATFLSEFCCLCGFRNFRPEGARQRVTWGR